MKHLLSATLAIGLAFATTAQAQTSFVTFESGLVRPLGISPDGSTLFAVNTPDNTLEIFDIVGGTISKSGSVSVGLEPVAIAVRNNTEVWVVNHLSDSVSIVDLTGAPRVVRTLLVGDEPNDIVFAGTGGNRAFISTAHRGQNAPTPRGEYDTPGVGRADVWVFDATSLGTDLGGTPLTIVTLFTDTPRGLAVSPDGLTVYAAGLHTGNRTTIIGEALVCDTSSSNLAAGIVQPSCTIDGQTVPGGSPPPHQDQDGHNRPETGLILKENRDGFSPGVWQDELGRDWSSLVRFDLPDEDVFAIDADAAPPAQTQVWSGVGTTLFNLVTNPVSGKIYVSNTDSRNEVRFEGPGTIASTEKPVGEPATVRGHLAEAHITVLDGASVLPRHLNKHIDYNAVPVPAGIKDRSLATPTSMAVSADGATLYVAAFGSAKIGVFDTAELEADTFVPDAADHISLSGGGPIGVLLDGTTLYALTRFNNRVVVVDLTLGSVGAEVQSVPLHNPEPTHVIEGRPFLYDAQLTSSNGEASCAACHIFGDMDQLAWDLGNPDDERVANGNPFVVGFGTPFHPMKGPMTTQSLRGLVNMGPQHWRGDRQGNSNAAFNGFNVAFPGLIGRDEGEFSASDMQKFTNFALELTYPPNPIRRLDNSLRLDEQLGRNLYFGRSTDGFGNCNDCHTLDGANGFFGGDGQSSVEGETQEFKVAHLRNMYQKVGMFGMPSTPNLAGDFTHQGDQIRGYGFLHDGAIDTMARFVGAGTFSVNLTEEQNLEAFMMAFPSDLPPVVGQQITRTSTNGATVDPRIDAMIAAAGTAYPSKLLGAGATQCDVVIKANISGEQRGGWLVGSEIVPDNGATPLAEATVRALSNTAGQEITYTCVPFGSGERIGVDRDGDTIYNAIDNCPDVPNPSQADADSNEVGDACEPGATTTTTLPSTCGNGVAEGFEECDGSDLLGFVCEDLGLVSGTLGCSGSCTFDTSACGDVRGTFINRSLKFSRLTKPAGQQKLLVKSDDLDGTGLVFDPSTEGLTLRLIAGSGATVGEAAIVAGDPDWKISTKRFKWKAKSAVNATGLHAVSIGVAGAPFRVTIKGRDLDATGAEGLADVTLQLLIGDDVWEGPSGPCSLSGSGSTLRCRP